MTQFSAAPYSSLFSSSSSSFVSSNSTHSHASETARRVMGTAVSACPDEQHTDDRHSSPTEPTSTAPAAHYPPAHASSPSSHATRTGHRTEPADCVDDAPNERVEVDWGGGSRVGNGSHRSSDASDEPSALYRPRLPQRRISATTSVASSPSLLALQRHGATSPRRRALSALQAVWETHNHSTRRRIQNESSGSRHDGKQHTSRSGSTPHRADEQRSRRRADSCDDGDNSSSSSSSNHERFYENITRWDNHPITTPLRRRVVYSAARTRHSTQQSATRGDQIGSSNSDNRCRAPLVPNTPHCTPRQSIESHGLHLDNSRVVHLDTNSRSKPSSGTAWPKPKRRSHETRSSAVDSATARAEDAITPTRAHDVVQLGHQHRSPAHSRTGQRRDRGRSGVAPALAQWVQHLEKATQRFWLPMNSSAATPRHHNGSRGVAASRGSQDRMSSRTSEIATPKQNVSSRASSIRTPLRIFPSRRSGSAIATPQRGTRSRDSSVVTPKQCRVVNSRSSALSVSKCTAVSSSSSPAATQSRMASTKHPISARLAQLALPRARQQQQPVSSRNTAAAAAATAASTSVCGLSQTFRPRSSSTAAATLHKGTFLHKANRSAGATSPARRQQQQHSNHPSTSRAASLSLASSSCVSAARSAVPSTGAILHAHNTAPGTQRLDLAREDDMKEFYRTVYTVDPQLQVRSTRRQFHKSGNASTDEVKDALQLWSGKSEGGMSELRRGSCRAGVWHANSVVGNDEEDHCVGGGSKDRQGRLGAGMRSSDYNIITHVSNRTRKQGRTAHANGSPDAARRGAVQRYHDPGSLNLFRWDSGRRSRAAAGGEPQRGAASTQRDQLGTSLVPRDDVAVRDNYQGRGRRGATRGSVLRRA